MIVRRTANGHEFTTYTTDGAFAVTLTLTDSGEETLQTVPMGVPVSFTPLKLKSGTIEKAIGLERWNNFRRMKNLDIPTMFIDGPPREFHPQQPL